MSDKMIKCARRKCGFICYEHQWKLVDCPDFRGAKKAICPQCGHDEYYEAKPDEVQKAMSGVRLIEIERLRQMNVEGFDSKRDDKYTDGELIKAAESYLVAVTSPDEEGDENGKSRPAWDWPWDKSWWKPSNDPIRNLTKAGALIAAEIDRLQRAKK
jgi:uncharacterized Zn finger protein (UPF0148 family)